MSCILELAVLAVAAVVTLPAATVKAIAEKASESQNYNQNRNHQPVYTPGYSVQRNYAPTVSEQRTPELPEKIPTAFADGELLLQTLREHGCRVDAVNENKYVVVTACGNLRYEREEIGAPFYLMLDEVSDVRGLMENIRTLEVEYGRNVQEYTYNHIKENLTDDMKIVSEEVLEDDSLLLTINIE